MKVVLANGCFDPLHYGHILHLRAAKRMGDILVVSITHDAHVFKGPGRPVFTYLQRLDTIRELRCVDRAIVVTDALHALKQVRPNIFVKGSEYRGKIEGEHEKYCHQHGIDIRFTDGLTWSSTALLHHYAR